MLRNRMFVALGLLALLFAGGLYADSVGYTVAKGNTTKVENASGVTVTAWSVSKVTYKTADGKTNTVAKKDIISIDRYNGSMSAEFSSALDLLGSDIEAAMNALGAIAKSGNPLDREEATWIRAQVLNDISTNNPKAVPEAIKAFNAYIGSYKAGYFARDAYANLAYMQENNRQRKAARATLKKMAGADSTLRREGNQLLGELEARDGKLSAAISAFQSAKSAASADKNESTKALATAWEGWMMLLSKKSKEAKALLESVTGNTKLDDPTSGEDEIALSVAYPALGDVHFAAGAFQKAYDAYVKGAYYSWWAPNEYEGRCLGRAYVCAKKLESTGAKWTNRKAKLRTALALGFPRVLQDAEKE